MNKKLLDVLCMSEKRKQVFLLLGKGAKETDYLLNSIGTTRQALLPQLKIMEEHCLIEHYDDTYKLTTIGKVVFDKVYSFLSTVDFLDYNIEYWGTHKLDPIPPNLLKYICKLGKSELFKPHITELFEINKEFHEATKRSRDHYVITTFMHPNFLELSEDLIKNHVNIHFIISQKLFEKLVSERNDDFRKLLQNELVNVFVCSKKIDFQFVSINYRFVMLALVRNNGEVDSNYLMCQGENAIVWGKDLFNYYKKDSEILSSI